MSRSFRKTPIFGNSTADSAKYDKRLMNRALRRKSKQQAPDEDALPVLKNDVMTEWEFSRDGKHYWKGATKKDMSK